MEQDPQYQLKWYQQQLDQYQQLDRYQQLNQYQQQDQYQQVDLYQQMEEVNWIKKFVMLFLPKNIPCGLSMMEQAETKSAVFTAPHKVW